MPFMVIIMLTGYQYAQNYAGIKPIDLSLPQKGVCYRIATAMVFGVKKCTRCSLCIICNRCIQELVYHC